MDRTTDGNVAGDEDRGVHRDLGSNVVGEEDGRTRGNADPGVDRSAVRTAERTGSAEETIETLTQQRAWLFDLDGVLTDTARVHAAAWKEVFDAFLVRWSGRTALPQSQFDIDHDYARYVDGRPRLDGVRCFLESRSIALPEGTPADPPGAETVHGLAAAKNDAVLRRIRDDGVDVFAASRPLLEHARELGIRRAVVSASANTRTVLDVTGLAPLVEVVVDGTDLVQRALRGKPSPDAFLLAAEQLGVAASDAAVFEDALAGVEAGRAGGFAVVVGVDRRHDAQALRAHGATHVVSDLFELLPAEHAATRP